MSSAYVYSLGDFDLDPENTFGVDFETYYDKDCSVAHLGAYAYTHHPDYYCYMVSIVGPGIKHVGPPEDAPWHLIAGKRWISHNSPFDRHVFDKLVEDGLVSADMYPKIWEDSCGLASYCRYPRSLDKLIKSLFDHTLNKGIRNKMKGKHYRDLPDEDKQDTLDYGYDDSVWMMKAWDELIEQWPKEERLLSLLTNNLSWSALPVDADMIDVSLKALHKIKWECEEAIPWVTEEETVVASPKKLADECRKCGVPPPITTEAKSQLFTKWKKRHGAKVPFVAALSRWRRANRMLRLFENMKFRVRPDGRMMFEMKYWGAHTGRWAGAAGLNVQNQAKDAFEGIDVRSVIAAGPGKKLAILDYSQIEPRVLAWLTNNKPALEMMRTGMSPYEVHARASMGYDLDLKMSDGDPKGYALAKARVLALGYGAGFEKFTGMAPGYIGQQAFEEIFRVDAPVEDWQALQNAVDRRGLVIKKAYDQLPDLEKLERVNAYRIVMEFRDSNPLITRMWKHLQTGLLRSLGDTLTVPLPSGYSLEYYNVSRNPKDGGITARFDRGATTPYKNIYGGLLTENVVQATARSVFAHGYVNVVTAGFSVLFHVHDELVIEVDKSVDLAEIEALMTKTPDWIPGLPVAVDGKESDHYLK